MPSKIYDRLLNLGSRSTSIFRKRGKPCIVDSGLVAIASQRRCPTGIEEATKAIGLALGR
jgi:hypothetical protein